MRQAINQHSFALVLLVLLAFAAIVRRAVPKLRWIPFVAVGALAVLMFVALRTGAGDVRHPGDLDRVLGKGRPVALELYSNY